MLSFRFILLFMCQLENVYMLLLTVRVPKGPENYNPTRPGSRVLWEPDAARHTSMNYLPKPRPNPSWTRPEPDPPRACIVFLIHLLSHAAAPGLRLCLPLPMKLAARLTLHHTWTAMIHNNKTIYNLQPARNVFYKKRKPEAQPDPAHLRIYSAWTWPEPAGPVGFVGLARPIENSTHSVHCCSPSIHPLSECSNLVSFSLRPPPWKNPSLLYLVSSHRPEQAPPAMFLYQLCWGFYNYSHAAGMTEGSDCITTFQRSW